MSFSPRVRELIAEYDRRIGETDAAALRDHIHGRAKDLGVTYGKRVVCNVLRPLFVERDHYEAILERSRLVLESLHAAARMTVGDTKLMDFLGFAEEDRRLVRIGAERDDHDLIARLDSFLDASGNPVFLEYNGESPGGIAYGDCLGEIFDESAIMKALFERHSLTRRPAVPPTVATFRAGYLDWCERNGVEPQEKPTVAMVDFEDIPTLGEFEIFRKAFEAAGMPCRIADPKRLDVDRDTGMVTLDGEFPVDIIYRRLITPDILERFDGRHLLVDIMESDLCFVANGFGGHRLSHKGLFALLTDPTIRPELSAEQAAAVDESIPWTRMAADADTSGPDGTQIEALDDIVRRHRTDLVLKPACGYGGRGVVLGWTSSEEAWENAWQEAKRGSFVVQKRVHIPREPWPAMLDGQVQFPELQFDVDPYVYGGAVTHGLGIRLSDGELLNVASGAGSAVPAYVLE